MGPRPVDFDESIVRQSPTFLKWLQLKAGERLRYACRDFIKGHGVDEERLMRRIMIARRNNLRDHEALKRARAATLEKQQKTIAVENAAPSFQIISEGAKNTYKKRKVRSPMVSDAQVVDEMDVLAVEATRSYRLWRSLKGGEEFIYNQKYIKGKEKHDWLLRKNIWRRMRYRRENKKMVKAMMCSKNQQDINVLNGYVRIKIPVAAATDPNSNINTPDTSNVAAGIVDHALLASAAAAAGEGEHIHKSVVEKEVVDAAVAAAESYVKGEAIEISIAGAEKIASMGV